MGVGVGVGQSLPSLMGVQGFLEGTLHRLKEKKNFLNSSLSSLI